MADLAYPTQARAVPTGTVTFLFTDIEGSTRRWDTQPQAMQTALARHDALLREAVWAYDGHVFKTVGDGMCAAFATAADAVAAAVAAQRALQAEPWGDAGPLRVRMALHTGAAEERDDDYFGPPLNRVARLQAVAYGGQVLLSAATAILAQDTLPRGVALRDLGEHRLKDLQRPEQIFQVVAPDLPDEFPPLRTLDSQPNNLPTQATPFLGRERELDTVRDLLARDGVRLLTLTGPGGVGKTRLALQTGAEALDAFSDGVYFVSLAHVTDPQLVVPEITKALGVQEAPGRPLMATLVQALKGRQLLILDNFEQVTAGAPLVAQLLAAAPGLKVLVTSRAVLEIYGEQEFTVPPLALPDPAHLPPIHRLSQFEAVRLFIERATSVKVDFAVTNENAPAVAEICCRLDGLPLAIELAAARIRMFSPQAMLARLERRLPMLTGGARNLPARQQTLRNAIAWSYELLDDGEKALFNRLAVFADGWTLEAAEQVCNPEGDLALEPFDGLSLLIGKSLVRQQDDAKGEPRFAMLQTIREFALEQLRASGEAPALEQRHAGHFLALAEEAAPEMRGPRQAEWAERLDAERANLRAALGWLAESGEVEEAWRMGAALYPFWHLRGRFTEGRQALESLLRYPEPPAPSAAARAARAGVLHGAGTLAQFSDYTATRRFYEEALAIRRELGDKRGIVATSNNLGNLLRFEGDNAGARQCFETALTLVRELGDQWAMAILLNNLGLLAHLHGDLSTARAHFEEGLSLARGLGDRAAIALALSNLAVVGLDAGDYAAARRLARDSLAVRQEIGDTRGITASLNELGEIARAEGDDAEARRCCEESLRLRREMGHKRGAGESLLSLAGLALDRGDPSTARTLLEESLVLFRELGARPAIAQALEGFAAVAAARGAPRRALALLGVAESLRESIGAPRLPEQARRVAAWLRPAYAALDETEQTLALNEGRAMSFEQGLEQR